MSLRSPSRSSCSALFTGEEAQARAQEYEKDTVTVTAYVLNVREGCGTDSKILTQIKKGEVYETVGEATSGWYPVKVGDKSGWVSGDYVIAETSYSYGETKEEEEKRIAEEEAQEKMAASVVCGADGRPGTRPVGAVSQGRVNTPSQAPGTPGQAVIDYACQFIGNPYVWGGTSLTNGEYMFKLLSRKTSPEWILEGDIKGCFDNISHDWMLENIPSDKRIMRQFLRCGYVENKRLFPTTEGSPQGGLISPTYANMTLDGLERLLLERYSTSSTGHYHPNYNKHKVHLCRYADDFIITADCKEVLEDVKRVVEEFMKERGLKLSEEKTATTNINDGFDFLGWNFRKFKGKLLIQPSTKSKKKITKKLSQTVRYYRESKQELLIVKLNQITKGWAEYHHCVCAKSTFALIDHRLWEMLWKWAKRRHPQKCNKWVKNRYWHPKCGRQWSFRTDTIVLYQMMDMPIVRVKSLDLNKNPFLNRDYFIKRKKEHEMKRKLAYQKSTAARSEYYVS